MDDIRALFLRQSAKDCEEAFREAVARPDAPSWDWLVVTAASETQAQAFRAQIDQRLAGGLLPRQTRYAVIPDPGGRRVGSGGATLAVLREIAAARGGDDPFSAQRVLVLHSGGDSQRIPQYSACGKLFARVPRPLWDGRPSTLFDEFLISLSGMPSRMSSGMLLMSGDVLLLFNALQIDLERAGAACLSIKAPVSTGVRHGVFVPDEAGGVSMFLHKQPETVLRSMGAVNGQGMVDIDTGAIWLDEARVNALYGLVRDGAGFARFVNDRVRLSLYGDFVYPMAASSTLESYLTQPAETALSEELAACRRAVWAVLGNAGLSMIRLAPAEFIHFGTTGEWRSLLLEGEEKFPFLGWRRSVLSMGAGTGYAAINSIIGQGARIGDGCAIEDSRLGPNAVIGPGCVLSGVDFDGELPPGTALSVLPVEGGNAFCARFYGVSDNPKEATRLGEPLGEPLWTAPLHPVLADASAAAAAAAAGGGAPRRMSLRESFAAASLPHALARQERLNDEIRSLQIIQSLESGAPVDTALASLSPGKAGERQLEALEAWAAQKAAFPLKHRLCYALARAKQEGAPQRAAELDNACWQAVNDHMLDHARRELACMPPPSIVLDRAETSLPVRINWGGGWSDTPPYCLEHGGAVLNAAVLLEGRRPVFAASERIAAPVIRIISDDLGVARDYTRREDLLPGNPHDPHALCKAALSALGVVPGGEGPLAPLLERMGGGIALRTSVAGVPKGSGLGTSSILCASVARSLSRLLGQPDGDERIAWLTLCMEQLMNTGGGWQDQVGGLFPGIKLTSSRPGTPQKLSVRRIVMPEDALAELSRRHALVFTGQRRMARNILRDIMGKAVSNNPETLEILSAIQRLAVLMAYELETGDIDQFARLTREHWALSKRLDAGSSNTCIDHMVTVCQDLIDGVMICGAGGGGFMSMITKKDTPREALARRLDAVFQQSGVKVWDAELEA